MRYFGISIKNVVWFDDVYSNGTCADSSCTRTTWRRVYGGQQKVPCLVLWGKGVNGVGGEGILMAIKVSVKGNQGMKVCVY